MRALINKVTNITAGLDTLSVRLAVGTILVAHSAQKLFGSFGGSGLEGTAAWMTSIGLEPGLLAALLAGGAEFFGGILLILGLLVRPAALMLAVTMLVAIVAVHLEGGLFLANNGYEYALVLLAVTAGLFIRGAGSFSADLYMQTKLYEE